MRKRRDDAGTPLGPGQIRFRVHGPDTATDEVTAGVFSRQLGTLYRALRGADKAINGRSLHDYIIAKLSTTTPTALLSERPLPKFRGELAVSHSGIHALEDCIEAITVGAKDRAIKYEPCVKQVARFAKIGYSEIWTGETKVFRVDQFLTERAKSIVELPPMIGYTEAPLLAHERLEREWYKGTADGSFDGTVKAVDLRGALPQITLVLTAGGAPIDCICRADQIEAIRAALDWRARVYGRAIYDGTGGLPRRVEVRKIDVASGDHDFTRWKGSFERFDLESDWPDISDDTDD
jgi:hypothetical protein